MRKFFLVFSCLIFAGFTQNVIGKSPAVFTSEAFGSEAFGNKTAIIVATESDEILYQWQAEKTLVPASVLKIMTAQLALDHWGKEYRFKTDFYLDNASLWVKGFGDPYLVSEELDLIASELVSRLDGQKIDQIAIDATYFNDVKIAGRTSANDPYNAPLSAVAANFNTIFFIKKGDEVSSAEPQTPITPTAMKLAKSLSNGKHRINVGNAQVGQQYFAELLAEKLRARGVKVGNKVELGSMVPAGVDKLYQHINSNQLHVVLRGALEYSNNFIANQLFMMMGAPYFQSETNLSLAQSASGLRVKKKYGGQKHWQNFSIQEGAGLSRQNRLSAKQVLDILRDFEPHKELLKSYRGGAVKAKTGTLNGVRTFAGYLAIGKAAARKNYYFVFLFNEQVPFRYRDTLLDELVKKLKAN